MISVYKQNIAGRCWIGGRKLRCRGKARYLVCSRDGKPKSSRHEGTVCRHHLEPIIAKLCAEGHDWAEKA